jgi:PAS domain S-box-containing protein
VIKLLTNPIFMRMAGTLVIAIGAVLFFIWIIRRLRAQLTESMEERPAQSSNTDFTLAAYQGVIQKYKEQERELARVRDEERQRAASTEKVNTAVLSQLPSGVILFNRLGLVQQANPAAKGIFGYASPLGLHARDLFKGISALRSSEASAESGSAAMMQILHGCIANGQAAQRLEADYLTPKGEARVLGITLSPVRDPQGGTLGVACLTSDLTEITDLARQMRLREDLALLGEMSAGIAHEFKNSLATISGYAQMLRQDSDAATVQNFSAKIADETANLTRVVTDFLNFARPQSLDDSLSEATPLSALIEDCAQNCPVELELSNCPGAAVIEGDATAWRQAFSNLLRNSAEAARPGILARVSVVAEYEQNQLRITVRDNGCGISPAQLEKIFIPFFTTKPQGTGLGLALVHRIVTQHGGTIKVSSNESGTEFVFTAPGRLAASVTAGSEI